MTARCAISGCSSRVRARGLCNTHYAHARYNGTLSAYPTLNGAYHDLLTASQVVEMTGISYRMLDHWCRRAVLDATHDGCGSGDYRRFSEADVAGIRAVMAEWGEATRLRRRVQSGETFREAAMSHLVGDGYPQDATARLVS